MTYDELSDSMKAKDFFGVTGAQWKLVSAVMMRDQLSNKQMYSVLWPNPDDEPENCENVMRQHMFRARKKIAKHGLAIKLVWGKGYYMTKEDRAKAIELARKAMEQ